MTGSIWRAHLTPDERREVATLDRIIAKAEKPARIARKKRQTIQNRATVRAGKAEK